MGNADDSNTCVPCYLKPGVENTKAQSSLTPHSCDRLQTHGGIEIKACGPKPTAKHAARRRAGAEANTRRRRNEGDHNDVGAPGQFLGRDLRRETVAHSVPFFAGPRFLLGT